MNEDFLGPCDQQRSGQYDGKGLVFTSLRKMGIERYYIIFVLNYSD